MRIIVRIGSGAANAVGDEAAAARRTGCDGITVAEDRLAGAQPPHGEVAAIEADVVLDAVFNGAHSGVAGRLETACAAARRAGATATIVPASSNPLLCAPDVYLQRAGRTLIAAVPAIERLGCQVWLENARHAHASRELWHLCDTAGSDSVRVCLNLARSTAAGESISAAIKRLGVFLGAVVIPLASLNVESEGDGRPDDSRVDASRSIELLKGIGFRGFVIVEGSLDESSPKAIERLRADIQRAPIPMSAYKGDKNAPRYPQQPAAAANPTP